MFFMVKGDGTKYAVYNCIACFVHQNGLHISKVFLANVPRLLLLLLQMVCTGIYFNWQTP